MLTITKQLQKLAPVLIDADGLDHGEFLYGLVRLIKPTHVLMHVSETTGRVRAAYVGQALKDNGRGGMSVIGGDLSDLIAKLGLGMQVLRVPADYEVPVQYDLDLLMVDSHDDTGQFADRLRFGGYKIGPALALDDTGGMDLPGNLMMWRR